MTTHLVDEELELDDGGAALVLTVALHTCTAEAESWPSQRKQDSCWERSGRHGSGKLLIKRETTLLN